MGYTLSVDLEFHSSRRIAATRDPAGQRFGRGAILRRGTNTRFYLCTGQWYEGSAIAGIFSARKIFAIGPDNLELVRVLLAC